MLKYKVYALLVVGGVLVAVGVSCLPNVSVFT